MKFDPTLHHPVTFADKKRFYKNDSVVRNLNIARNAIYRAGLEATLADGLTEAMHDRFDFLEKVTR